MARWLIVVLVIAAAVVAAVALGGGGEGWRAVRRRRATAPASTAALQRIADEHGGTRAAGTAGDRATSAYLVEQLRADGYRVRTQKFRVPLYRERRPPRLVVGGRRVRGVARFQFSPSAS